MNLYKEWEQKAKNVSTEYLSMSINELINRYKGNRLRINPSYQRHYRWTNEQKSNFIESLILGYPIPPIFLYKNIKSKKPGEFEVIDGLQRLATIFEFIGILNPEIKPKEVLKKLEKTDILESLEGKTWESFIEEGLDFILDSRIIQAVVLDNKNELKTKYEIFRRLNSSSTKLSDQEIRNATLFETSTAVFTEIEEKFKILDFTFLSDTDKNERKDMELFLEFMLINKIINNNSSNPNIKFLKDKDTFSKILNEFSFSLTEAQLKDGMIKFIEFISNYSKYRFKKYNPGKDNFEGLFINAFFEILVTIYLENPHKNIPEKITKELFSKTYNQWLKEVGLVNPNAKTRMLKAIEYARGINL